MVLNLSFRKWLFIVIMLLICGQFMVDKAKAITQGLGGTLLFINVNEIIDYRFKGKRNKDSQQFRIRSVNHGFFRFLLIALGLIFIIGNIAFLRLFEWYYSEGIVIAVGVLFIVNSLFLLPTGVVRVDSNELIIENTDSAFKTESIDFIEIRPDELLIHLKDKPHFSTRKFRFSGKDLQRFKKFLSERLKETGIQTIISYER
ncbi:MAG: hypothetical protein AAFX87_19975 [Bacteroidota bacterium]